MPIGRTVQCVTQARFEVYCLRLHISLKCEAHTKVCLCTTGAPCQGYTSTASDLVKIEVKDSSLQFNKFYLFTFYHEHYRQVIHHIP